MEYADDDHKMISYAARLKTFRNWPFFGEDANCTPDKVDV